MKKYTQADFDAMVRGQIVFLYCKSGDWSEANFHGAKKVIFSDWCKLGNGCKLGDEIDSAVERFESGGAK